MTRVAADGRLMTQIYPTHLADPGKPKLFLLFQGMLREGGIRIRTWDAAIDRPPEEIPYLDMLIQLDGDTLLRVHPQSLERADMMQQQREAVSRTLNALMGIRRRLTYWFSGFSVLLVSAWSVTKFSDWIQSGLAWSDQDTGFTLTLFLGLLLYLTKARVIRLLLHLFFRFGSAWLSTELLGVGLINRLSAWGSRLFGIRKWKRMDFPVRFRSLLEASIDPEDEQENRLSETLQKTKS